MSRVKRTFGNTRRKDHALGPTSSTSLLALPNEILHHIVQILNEPKRPPQYKPNYKAMLELAVSNKRLLAISAEELKAAQPVKQASLIRSYPRNEPLIHFEQCFANARQLRPRRPKLEAFLISYIGYLGVSDQFDVAKYVLTELAKSDHDQNAQYTALFAEIPQVIRGWPNVEENRSDQWHNPRSRDRRSMLVNLLDCALQVSSKHSAETRTAAMRTTAMLGTILEKLAPSDIAPHFDALLEIAEKDSARLAIALAEKLPQLPSQGLTARFDKLLSIAQHHRGKLVQILGKHLDELPAEDQASRFDALLSIAQDGEFSLVRRLATRLDRHAVADRDNRFSKILDIMHQPDSGFVQTHGERLEITDEYIYLYKSMFVTLAEADRRKRFDEFSMMFKLPESVSAAATFLPILGAQDIPVRFENLLQIMEQHRIEDPTKLEGFLDALTQLVIKIHLLPQDQQQQNFDRLVNCLDRAYAGGDQHSASTVLGWSNALTMIRDTLPIPSQQWISAWSGALQRCNRRTSL